MINVKKSTIEQLNVTVDLFEKYRAFYKCEENQHEAKKFISERIENNESVIFLAYITENGKEKAIGFTQLYPLYSSTAMKKLWLLNDLYVVEAYRRHQVGEKLIDSSIELAKSTKARGVFLETVTTNKAAQSLYEKKGFVLNSNLFYGFDIERNS